MKQIVENMPKIHMQKERKSHFRLNVFKISPAEEKGTSEFTNTNYPNGFQFLFSVNSNELHPFLSKYLS